MTLSDTGKPLKSCHCDITSLKCPRFEVVTYFHFSAEMKIFWPKKYTPEQHRKLLFHLQLFCSFWVYLGYILPTQNLGDLCPGITENRLEKCSPGTATIIAPVVIQGIVKTSSSLCFIYYFTYCA